MNIMFIKAADHAKRFGYVIANWLLSLPPEALTMMIASHEAGSRVSTQKKPVRTQKNGVNSHKKLKKKWCRKIKKSGSKVWQ